MSNGDLYPKSLKEGLDKLPNVSKWAKAVMAKESVTYIWNEEWILERTKARLEKLRNGPK